MIHGLLENAGIPASWSRSAQRGRSAARLRPRDRGFGGGPQRVMVHANRAEQARALLAETLVEDEEEAWPEIANAEYLEDADDGKTRSGKARDYGLVGAYARAIVWSLGIMAAAFAVFLLLRAV